MKRFIAIFVLVLIICLPISYAQSCATSLKNEDVEAQINVVRLNVPDESLLRGAFESAFIDKVSYLGIGFKATSEYVDSLKENPLSDLAVSYYALSERMRDKYGITDEEIRLGVLNKDFFLIVKQKAEVAEQITSINIVNLECNSPCRLTFEQPISDKPETIRAVREIIVHSGYKIKTEPHFISDPKLGDDKVLGFESEVQIDEKSLEGIQSEIEEWLLRDIIFEELKNEIVQNIANHEDMAYLDLSDVEISDIIDAEKNIKKELKKFDDAGAYSLLQQVNVIDGNEVGGDYLRMFNIKGKILIANADIMGHGLKASVQKYALDAIVNALKRYQ